MKPIFIKIVLVALAVLLSPKYATADLVINELMQSNINSLLDDLNEYPDSWVELYNSGSNVENLKEYRIGSSSDLSKAYKLPSQTINPGEFVVIFCDKANNGLHTDFRLESGKGGAVYLFYDNEIVSKVEDLKKQPAPNISYGVKTEGDSKWGYQLTPTPGSSNCNILCKDILPDPLFSVTGKAFSKPFELIINLPEGCPENAKVRYTLDCTEPTENSPSYTHPLNIEQTTIIRAKIFCDGYLSPISTTHSYIRHPRELTLPLVSIVSDDRNFYDEQIGILVKGSYNPELPNYEYDWRRPINLEYFEDSDTKSIINQLCETRVKGGSTRKLPLKSMAVYANKRFGTKRFNHDFFPDQTPGISEFKSFELRNSGDDFNSMYMRDAIIQRSMGMNCDLDWQPSRPAVVYINGIYKGILNIRPRSNEDYVYSYYDGLEDLDMIENWFELKEGSKDNFNAFKQFYNEEGHSYEEFNSLMDVEEFCNLMIMNIFFDNKDFPANNIIMWRPIEEGGRWRWIAKDTDFGLGHYSEPFDYPTLFWITTPGYDDNHNYWANAESASLLFRRLLDTDEFRELYIERSAIYLGDFLTAEQIIKLIDSRYEELKFEYPFHRENLGDHSNKFRENVEVAKEWIQKRGNAYYSQVGEFFGLQSPVPLTVKMDKENGDIINFNGILLKNSQFNGQFYPERKLNISLISDSDGILSGKWIVTIKNNDETSSLIYDSPELDMKMPHADEVLIEFIHSDSNGVNLIDNCFNADAPFEVYDLAGRAIMTTVTSSPVSLPSGVYIIRQKDNARKIVIK